MSFGSKSRSSGAKKRGHNNKSEREKLSDDGSKTPNLKPNNYTYVSSSRMLRTGDHIATYRRPGFSPIGYYHHGIYMGDDEVIEFNEDGVVEVTFADFMDSCKVYRVEYGSGECYNASTVCDRARNRLHNDDFGSYHMVNWNCQHFATDVKTGKAWSDQSIRARFFSLGFASLP